MFEERHQSSWQKEYNQNEAKAENDKMNLP
jgi:hypothetical protein